MYYLIKKLLIMFNKLVNLLVYFYKHSSMGLILKNLEALNFAWTVISLIISPNSRFLIKSIFIESHIKFNSEALNHPSKSAYIYKNYTSIFNTLRLLKRS